MLWVRAVDFDRAFPDASNESAVCLVTIEEMLKPFFDLFEKLLGCHLIILLLLGIGVRLQDSEELLKHLDGFGVALETVRLYVIHHLESYQD